MHSHGVAIGKGALRLGREISRLKDCDVQKDGVSGLRLRYIKCTIRYFPFISPDAKRGAFTSTSVLSLCNLRESVRYALGIQCITKVGLGLHISIKYNPNVKLQSRILCWPRCR